MANLPRVLVLTALGKEFGAVKSLAKTEFKEVVHPAGTIFEAGVFPATSPRWELDIVETGRGGGRAGDEAHRGIAFLQPRIVLMIGVAGGLKDVHRGDVVAATKVYDYESGKIAQGVDGTPTFYPRPEIGVSSHRLVQRARSEARTGRWRTRISDGSEAKMPNAIVEPIATGGKVVAAKNNEVYRRVTDLYSDAVALEMESYDVLRVAYSSGIDCLAVRGISDMLVGKSTDDAEGGQDIAARNAAAFALEVLEKLDVDHYRSQQPGAIDELGTRIVPSNEASPFLEELGSGVDAYYYRGHLGRYPRTAVAGQLITTSLKSGAAPKLLMQLVLIDPADEKVMDAYAGHRRAQGLDAGLSPSEAIRHVRQEILATVVRMQLWKGFYPRLSVDIRMAKHISLIRIDLCAKIALITKDNPIEPMIVLRPGTAFYKTFKDELQLAADQARKLTEVPGIGRGDLNASFIKRLFGRIGVGTKITSSDADRIMAVALDDAPPYGRHPTWDTHIPAMGRR